MAAFEEVKKSIFLLNLSDTEIYTEKKIWPLAKKQMWNQRNGSKTYSIAQVVAQNLFPECDEVLWNITNQHKRIILQMIHQRQAHPFDSITELF